MSKKEYDELSQDIPRFLRLTDIKFLEDLPSMTAEELAPHLVRFREEFKDCPCMLKSINKLASAFMKWKKNDKNKH